MFLGCSGTTSLGGKWLFLYLLPRPRVRCDESAERSARRGGSLHWQPVSLQRSHGVRRHTQTFSGSSPPSDEVRYFGRG